MYIPYSIVIALRMLSTIATRLTIDVYGPLRDNVREIDLVILVSIVIFKELLYMTSMFHMLEKNDGVSF